MNDDASSEQNALSCTRRHTKDGLAIFRTPFTIIKDLTFQASLQLHTLISFDRRHPTSTDSSINLLDPVFRSITDMDNDNYNPLRANPPAGDQHLNSSGSKWLWAVFALFAVSWVSSLANIPHPPITVLVPVLTVCS